MRINFTATETAVLVRRAARKHDRHCEECGDSCHPDDSKRDYEQWLENQLCRQCNDNGFEEEKSELGALQSLGF